jgi:hypothetical protein
MSKPLFLTRFWRAGAAGRFSWEPNEGSQVLLNRLVRVRQQALAARD